MYCMWTCVSCVVRTNGAKYMHAYVRQISKYLFIYLLIFFPRIIFCTYIIINKYIYIYIMCTVLLDTKWFLPNIFQLHISIEAPRDSREPHPRLCTRRPLTKPKCPGAKWWMYPLSLSLCLSLSLYVYAYIYIYVCMYIYCASMQKYCKYTGMCGGM